MMNQQMYASGGSLPGPDKTLEQAHGENLLKYRKLKTKYFELETRYKDSLDQLERAREQNIRLKEEKAGCVDRVIELESIIHGNAPPPNGPMQSSAFPRNFVYPRAPSSSAPPDYVGMAKALDDDDDDDSRKNSKHVGAALKQREEEDEQRRADEERARRHVKRPRMSKSFVQPTVPEPQYQQPPGGYDGPGGQEDMYPPPQHQHQHSHPPQPPPGPNQGYPHQAGFPPGGPP